MFLHLTDLSKVTVILVWVKVDIIDIHEITPKPHYLPSLPTSLPPSPTPTNTYFFQALVDFQEDASLVKHLSLKAVFVVVDDTMT